MTQNIPYEHSYHLDEGQLTVTVANDEGRFFISLITTIHAPLLLHWGMAYRSRHEWVLPPSSLHPPGTTVFQDMAARTPFANRRVLLEIPEQEAPAGIQFVLKQSDPDRWINDRGQNFFIPVASVAAPIASALADTIIAHETGRNSWTLMHRFNLCYDLLDGLAGNDREGLALIYAWLRFSAIRQLDWQRNYNTKPRELGHAMGRLVDKLAGRFVNEPQERELIRLIMTTLGSGKDAQRVRDEILHIMHRHHIKEISGHFMEEWHQKLHNNATPDDIVICEAYLEFLRSNGNLDVFYRKLEEGGIPKKRLESYERPITSHPDFIPHLKDALLHDFGHFLSILKEVHAGVDLGAANAAARPLFDAGMRELMEYIWTHRNDHDQQAFVLLEKIIEARRRLAAMLGEHRSGVRDLLFLDLALEDFFRAVVEKQLRPDMDENQLMELTGMATANLCLSNPDEEFVYCLNYWTRLMKNRDSDHFSREKMVAVPIFHIFHLQAMAAVDRLQRGLGDFIDRYHRLLQPKAELLGTAFHAAPWTITLFTEEVVRGRPAFVLSMLLRKIDPVLRKSAGIGDWQVISPGAAGATETAGAVGGVVETVSHLTDVQGKRFTRPSVIVAGNVEGNEEIPKGVAALITSSSVDVLSHLAVRARNGRVFFAICYDHKTIEKLKSLSGRTISLGTSTIGEVTFEEGQEKGYGGQEQKGGQVYTLDMKVKSIDLTPVGVTAVGMDGFNERNVGGKSNMLKRMRGKLPEWIHLPASVALPFGVFEKVLALRDNPDNKEIGEQYDKLVRRIDEQTESYTGLLEEIKKTVLALRPPDALLASLRAVMEKEGLGWPGAGDVWTCIKRVWSSKWNERAYLSRKANGIPHAALLMAVLIQRVVEADYSFVVHTVNPLTNNKDELYAEVVLGLGETLAANYPGRALGFTCTKQESPRVLSFPGKSVGLFGDPVGRGLIFRSDSNGEDIAGYAGAGLYDSVILPPPAMDTLNYTEEALVWDEQFRNEFLLKIAGIGTAVEKSLGGPQDIEGAYSNGDYYVVQSRPQVGLENAYPHR